MACVSFQTGRFNIPSIKVAFEGLRERACMAGAHHVVLESELLARLQRGLYLTYVYSMLRLHNKRGNNN